MKFASLIFFILFSCFYFEATNSFFSGLGDSLKNKDLKSLSIKRLVLYRLQGAQCGADRKQKACTLLAKHNEGILKLAKDHPSGDQDNAYAYNNIKDMCDGKRASKSSYSCSTCRIGAPGGTVCLKKKLLDYLIDLVSRGRVNVTELAGGCHSCNSRHYKGEAVDIKNDTRSTEYINVCRRMGGYVQDKNNNVHCHFLR